MGRNANSKAARAFRPEAGDADLLVELIGASTDDGQILPILGIKPQTDLGTDWFSPDRQAHLRAIKPAESLVFNVVREAVLDGLVVVLSVDGHPPQVHWSSRAAWRTRQSSSLR